MTPITDHYDGHGLNECLIVTRDKRDHDTGGGASHLYKVVFPDGAPGVGQVAEIQFQHGARHEKGSTPGITDAVLLAIVLDRYRCFQAGPFTCGENERVIGHLEGALANMKSRADTRARRGVLGKNKK